MYVYVFSLSPVFFSACPMRFIPCRSHNSLAIMPKEYTNQACVQVLIFIFKTGSTAGTQPYPAWIRQILPPSPPGSRIYGLRPNLQLYCKAQRIPRFVNFGARDCSTHRKAVEESLHGWFTQVHCGHAHPANLDCSIRVEIETVKTHAAVVITPALEAAIVIKQIPIAIDIYNGVMTRPDA